MASTQRQSTRETIAQLWQQGKDLQQQGESDAALEVYRSILELDARYLPALHKVAQICESRGEFAEAIEVYQQALEVDEEPPFWVYRHLGFALSQKGELEGATEAYRQAISLQMDDVATYNLLGQVRGKLGDLEGAVSSYGKAIELQPKQPSWVYLNFAEALERQGHNDRAIAAYEQALELEPENAGIRRLLEVVVARKEASQVDRTGLAQQLQEQGQLDEALAEYQTVLTQNGSNLAALHQVAKICESQEKWDEAIEAYRKAVEVDAEPPFWVYRHLGFALNQKGEWDEAVEVYEKAIALNPEDTATRTLLGKVLESTGDSERQIVSYQKAIEVNPQQEVGVYINLGNALAAQGQLDKAIEVYERAIALYPEFHGAREKLGDVLAQRGRAYLLEAVGAYQRAIEQSPSNIELCHKALEISPRDARLYTKLASALVRHDRLDEAIVFFRMGLEVDPNIERIASELFLEFGNTWAKQGKFLDAIRVYREGLDRDRDNDLLAWQIQNTQAMHDREFAYPIETVEHIRLREPQPLSLPTSDTPVISIIIPVYNQILHTYNCLRSLADIMDGSLPFEVIVMDDHSSDNTQEVLARVQGVRSVFNEENLGFIGSCNRGASLAKGEYLFFLNNDTVVMPNCIEELLATFKIVPKAGLVGAKLLYPNGLLQEAGGIIWQDGSAWNYGRLDRPNKPEYCYLREVDYCSGAGIMIPTNLWNQIGGFDTRYRPAYCEDSDLAFEVRKAGYKVLCQPLSKIVHFEGISSGTDLTKGVKKYQIVNQKQLIEKWAAVLQTYRQNGVDPHLEREKKVKKRLLTIDACILTPDRDAGSETAFNLIKVFQALSYKVTFAADNLLYVSKYTEDLQRLGVECLYCSYVTSVKEHLQQYGSQYEVIYLTRVAVAEKYIDTVREFAPQAKVIFETADLHHLREEREAELKNDAQLYQKAKETKLRELTVMNKADCTLLVSTTEKKILQQTNPELKNIQSFNIPREIYGCPQNFKNRKDILFIGGFRHTPNIDAMTFFTHQVFPLIQKSIQDIKLFIVGSHPTEEIKELASESVTVTGYVADISEYFNRCRLSVAPLRYGAGVKGKVLTSFGYGVPVVATSIAAEGMELQEGHDVLIADAADDFAKQVIALYSDKDLWEKLSQNSLKTMHDRYSMTAVIRRFQNLLKDLGL